MAHFSEGARDAWRIPQPHSSFDDTGTGASGPGPGHQEVRLAAQPLLRKAKFLAVLRDKLTGFVRREKGAEGASGASAPLWENSTVYNRSSIRVC